METNSKQEPAEYYDEIYKDNEYYARSGEDAGHKRIWDNIIADLSKDIHASNRRIIELGCGTGQLAELLLPMEEFGFAYLLGIDFSTVAIDIARSRFKDTYINSRFVVGNLFDCEQMYRDLKPDTVIATEVFEHIKEDKKLLGMFSSGTEFYITVPDFGGRSHVRFFENEKQVRAHYSDALDIREVVEFKSKNHTIFLIKGKIK